MKLHVGFNDGMVEKIALPPRIVQGRCGPRFVPFGRSSALHEGVPTHTSLSEHETAKTLIMKPRLIMRDRL